MGYKYRLCFEFARESSLQGSGKEFHFKIPGQELPIKVAAVGSKKDLAQDNRISISAGPFDSKEEANRHALDAKDCLLAYGLIKQAGIDVGLYAPSGVITNDGLAMMSEELGKPVLNDQLGITLFEGPPDPQFCRAEFKARAKYNTDDFANFFRKNYGRTRIENEDLEFAIQLYSLSFNSGNSRASFAILFMCLDLIIPREKREHDVQILIDEFVATTNGSNIPDDQKSQLCGGLNSLRVEPMRAAVMKYAHELIELSEINGQTPPEFFKFASNIRNKVIHGGTVDDQVLRTTTDGMGTFVSAILKRKIGLT